MPRRSRSSRRSSPGERGRGDDLRRRTALPARWGRRGARAILPAYLVRPASRIAQGDAISRGASVPWRARGRAVRDGRRSRRRSRDRLGPRSVRDSVDGPPIREAVETLDGGKDLHDLHVVSAHRCGLIAEVRLGGLVGSRVPQHPAAGAVLAHDRAELPGVRRRGGFPHGHGALARGQRGYGHAATGGRDENEHPKVTLKVNEPNPRSSSRHRVTPRSDGR
jgi:hypothetical protein